MLPSGPSSTNSREINSSVDFSPDESSIDSGKRSSSDASVSIGFRQNDAAKTPLPATDGRTPTKTAHTAPALAARSVAEAQAAQAVNTEPQKIADGVFIGEGRAKSGEKFFLKMEKVTRENKANWDQYLQATLRLVGSNRSLLKSLVRTTEKAVTEDGTTCFVNQHYDEVAPLVGLSQEEFQEFIDLLGKRGFTSAPEDKGKRAALLDIDAGAGAVFLGTDEESYVIYATKTADFQMPRAINHESTPQALSLKDYISRYGDLLMCVGSNFSWKNGFHSRGIFRNPYNTIANTHKGIAMILHGFTAAVAKKYFPDKQSLFVKPITSMQYLICSSMQPDDYSVEKYSHDEALEASKEAFLEGENFEMPINTIKVGALDRLYRGHASA